MAKAVADLSWFSRAAEDVAQSSAYRRLGSSDMEVGFAIGDAAEIVRFEAFGIPSIVSVESAELRDADFVVRMSPKDWNAYLRKRKKGSGPSLLTLDMDQGIVDAPNPLKKLKFERYNLTLQAFVDHGAGLVA